MVASAIGGIVLLGVLTTNLQLIRSGIRIHHYSEMQAQVRRGLERLGVDAKIATGIRWNGTNDVTLTVPDSGGGTTQVTYAWTVATQSFFLVPGADSSVTAGRVYLVQGIAPLADGSPGVAFQRFDRDGSPATTDLATKRILVSMAVSRQVSTMAAATENAVVASFTLRNKPIE